MNTIAQEWEEFQSILPPKELAPNTHKVLKRAFYYGVVSGLQLAAEAGGAEDGVAEAHKLLDEVGEFEKAVVAGEA